MLNQWQRSIKWSVYNTGSRCCLVWLRLEKHSTYMTILKHSSYITILKWQVFGWFVPNISYKTLISDQFLSQMISIYSRAGTIRSAADRIRIRYGPCRYDMYSIRYTCTWLKVLKSRILDFNNKVNVLGWSIQWIQQILVLKRNDHRCSVYHSFIHKVLVENN